jgi:hypothetical protein
MARHRIPDRPRQVARPLKGWRTVRELTAELRFPSEDACREWLRRQGIASVRRGPIIPSTAWISTVGCEDANESKTQQSLAPCAEAAPSAGVGAACSKVSG